MKIVVVRWWRSLNRYLPHFGITVFALLVVTWATSAGDYLARGEDGEHAAEALGAELHETAPFSLLAAVVITVLVVTIVTTMIGPGLDSEKLHDLGLDDRLEEIEDQQDNPGPG